MLADSGRRVAWLDAGAAAWLAASTAPAEWAFVNIGVNDMTPPATAQASYEASLGSLLDKIHAAWPSCNVGVSKVWMPGRDAESDAMAGWVDNVLSTRAAWASVSDDERVWLKGADNGATMCVDGGPHYSAAGNAEKVNQIKTWMGY